VGYSQLGMLPVRHTNNLNMKINTIICSTLTLSLLAGGLTACCCTKGKEKEVSEAKLEAQANVTKAEAEKIALEKVPGGTIKEGDIEKEKGKLLWSFDITTPSTRDITEVQVDAMTGAVLDVSKETVADQEKEKTEDAKKAKNEKEDDEKEEKK
jgi:hypothetical protein